ncbi:MAG: DUF5329 domain-containing protein [Casimicrobiaceae bacterium]
MFRLRIATMALTWALWAATPAWAHPPPAVQQEIAKLLAYLEASGCEFQRNGQWHDARAARAHIETKYRYLLRRDMVQSTDDFIERAATSSSMGGAVYTVRCADGVVHPSGEWMRHELVRLRKAGPATATP